MSFHPGPFFRNPPHPFHFPPSYHPFPAGWDPSVSLAHPYIYDPTQVKHRRRTTPEQLRILEDTFKTDPKPNAALRKKLSLEIGMTPRVLQVWFQNRRMKVKRMAKKSAESAAPQEPEGSSDPADPALSPNSENHDSPSSPVPSEPSRAATPANDASTAAASAPSPSSTSATNTASGSSLVPPAHSENIRRGSLPTALVSPSSLALDASLNDTFPSVTDPALVRRRSMTSLHRLESHPFAPLVAANNGLGPLPTHTVVPPTPPAFTPSRASFPQYHHHSSSGPAPVQPARLLPTARAASFHFLPSPQHLHAFNPHVPAQQQQPYAFPPRPLAPPRPGPLPAPDYSFGTPPAPLPQQQDESVDVCPYISALTAPGMPRLSAGGDDDTDTEYSSRFGSIASDVSSASAWAAVAPASDGEQRRGSWSTGHVADMLSGLAVAGGGPAKDAAHLWVRGASSTESLVYPEDALDQAEAAASTAAAYDAAGRYGDSTAIAVKFEDPPTSFVSAGPASAAVAAGQRDLPISQSSELAFALCGVAQAAIACGGEDQQLLDLQ